MLIMAAHQLMEAGANGPTTPHVHAPVGEEYSAEKEHAPIHRECGGRVQNSKMRGAGVN